MVDSLLWIGEMGMMRVEYEIVEGRVENYSSRVRSNMAIETEFYSKLMSALNK